MADIITYGGGFGASKHDNNLWNASEGGSGGGGSGGRASSSSYGGLAANGFSGQGFAGSNSATTWYPGGGGGANAIGANNPANGGNGFYSTILGANGVYANGYWFGGGGGGAGYSARAGNGGLGGGGGGAPFVSDGGFGGLGGLNNGNNSTAGSLNSQTNVPGGNGGINTGGGGGGGSHYNSNNQGGSGGSGIVIFRYQIPNKPTAVQVNGANADITINQYIVNSNLIPVSPIPGYGTGPYTYSVSPALPTGLSIDSANGAILGQPTVAVTSQPYTVTVTDSLAQAANANFTLTTSTTYLYALELNTTSIDVTTYYGLDANNFTPTQIGGNTEIQIESYQTPTELPYQTNPVTTIPVMAGQTYGYTGQNLNITELDASFNNYLDLDDKLRTIYGCVNANVSGFFLSSQEFTTPGTYSWTVPNGVTSISVAGIGGGGAGSQKASGGTGGGGGQLKYANNISVTPGQVYTIVVGEGGITGGDYGNSGGYTTMTLASNGNIVLSAAGGAGGDRLYWIANTSQITANDANANLFTFQAGISGGQSITYNVSNGSLPTGAAFNTSTGVLSWTRQSIGNTTTYPTFTVSALAANQQIDSPVSLTILPVTDGFTISPAVDGKSTWYPGGDGPLSLSTAGTWTLTPLNTFTMTAKVWGAGGGSTGNSSGAGGCAVANIQFNQATVYTLIVGNTGAAGGGASGSGGGAGSGIHNGSTHVIIAGGGGGHVGGAGGGGGGTSGQAGTTDGNDGQGGGAGTQVAAGGGGGGRNGGGSGSGPGATTGGGGGTGGGNTGVTAVGGTGYGNGGPALARPGDGGGSGGGGGYYGGGGGGAGGWGGGGGGGGSGYLNPSLTTNGILYQAAGNVAGNANDAARGTSGNPKTAGKIYLSL